MARSIQTNSCKLLAFMEILNYEIFSIKDCNSLQSIMVLRLPIKLIRKYINIVISFAIGGNRNK